MPDSQVPFTEQAMKNAREAALLALAEITEPDQVGDEQGCEVIDQRTVILLFASRSEGYFGWRWAVTLTQVDAAAPITVSEVALVPGPDSLLAPE